MAIPHKCEMFGVPGSLIPGSRYRRAYCSRCGEPIRIEPHDESAPYWKDYSAEMCRCCYPESNAPPAHEGLVYRQRIKLKA